MASVEKRTRAGRVTWLVRWWDPAGKQRKRSFPRAADAQTFRTTLDHSMLIGAYVDPAAGKVRLGVWAEKWLASQVQLKRSTRDGYEGVLRVHVLPRWGGVPLSAVSHSDVRGWVAGLVESGLSASRVRLAHRVLSMVLGSAVSDQKLARNVADGVPLPRVRAKEKRFITPDKLAVLAEAAGEYRLAVLVLGYCGLRFGELAALRVRRVDLMRRRIEVAESVTEVRGGLAWSDPKRYRRRSVPVPRFLVDDLAAHMVGRQPDDLLFPAPEGGVLRNTNFRDRVWDPARKAAGLEWATPKSLRDAAASLAIASGGNAKDVQAMLGHRSAAMTYDVYGVLWEDSLDNLADRMSAHAPPRAELPPPADVRPLRGSG